MTRLFNDSTRHMIQHHVQKHAVRTTTTLRASSTRNVAVAVANTFNSSSEKQFAPSSSNRTSSLYNVGTLSKSSSQFNKKNIRSFSANESSTISSMHNETNNSNDEHSERHKVYAQLMENDGNNTNAKMLLSDPILSAMVYDAIKSYASGSDYDDVKGHHHHDKKNIQRAAEMLTCVLDCHEIMRNMKDEEHDELLDVIETVVSGWRNIDDPNKIQFLSSLIQKLENFVDQSSSHHHHHLVPYTTVLGVLTKVGGTSAGDNNYNNIHHNKKMMIDAALLAEEILDTLEQKSRKIRYLQPTTEMYNAVMTCWARCRNHVNYPLDEYIDGESDNLDIKPAWRADAIFQRMERLHDERLDGKTHFYHDDHHDEIIVKPNKISYNTILAALASEIDGSTEGYAAAHRCDEILRRMMSQYASDGYNDDSSSHSKIETAKPDVVTLGTVLGALTRNVHHMNESGGTNASSLDMHNKGKHGSQNVNLIKADNKGYHDNLQRAEALLERMQSLHEETGDIDLAPNTINFNLLMGGLTSLAGSVRGSSDGGDRGTYGRHHHQDDALRQAEELLERMHNLYASGTNRSAKPDTVTYNSIVAAYSKRSGIVPGSAEKAESILKRMMETGEKISNRGNIDLGENGCGAKFLAPPPDSWTFNSVLSAWARSGLPNGADRATTVLNLMQDYYDAGHSTARPDVVSVSIVITALASSAAKGDRNAARQAEAIIDRMQRVYDSGQNEAMRPDALSYTALMRCWVNTGGKGAAGKAQSILRRMHRMYEDGNNDVKPDNVMYNVVLSALNKEREPGSARRAEALLRELEELHESTGDDDLRPTTISYSTVISAWSRSGEKGAAEKAESILRRMQDRWDAGYHDARPNTVAFTSVINAWAKSGVEGAAHRAERLLQRMQDSYESGNVDAKPNCFSCTSVIEAWANSGKKGSLLSAEAILQKMEDLSRSGDDDIRPNVITFNTMIKAVVRSPELGWERASRARELIRRMTDSGIHPTVVSYNSVLSACSMSFAATDGKVDDDIKKKESDIFKAACDTLNELRANKIVRPDAYTYPAMFKTCDKFIDIEEDWDKFCVVVNACCEDGLVDERVFNLLKSFVPEKQLREKLCIPDDLPLDNVRLDNLPSDWTRNATRRYQGKGRGGGKQRGNRRRRPHGRKFHNGTKTIDTRSIFQHDG